MKKRIFALLLALVLTVGLVSGCGSESGNEEGSAEKVFNMAISELPDVLNPTDGTDAAMTYLLALYERMYSIDADGNYDYYLAESCTPSDDGMTYTIKLREDATWSDGTPVTADDLIFTVAYYQTGAPSTVSTLLGGYTANKVDDHTVDLVLDTFVGSFFNDLCWMRLIPSHVFEGNVEAVDGSEKLSGTDVVTSGPYTIAEWNSGESLILQAREDYYRGKPVIDKLNFIVMPDSNAQELAFSTGDLSVLEISNVETYNKYNTADYNMTVFPANKVVHLRFNPDGQGGQGLTDDERNAFALAIDRDELVQTVYGSDVLATPAHSCFVSAQTYYNADLTHEQDLEQAAALAESTGLKDKTVTIIYGNYSAEGEGIATVLQQQLSKAGINAVVQGYDATAYYTRVFHVVFGATDTPEATDWDYAVGFDSGLYGDASSSMVSYSTMGMLGAEASGLMLAAYSNPDDAQREALFKQAQAANDEGHYLIPLAETNVVVAAQKNVTGVDAVKIKPIFADYWVLNVE